LHTQISCFSAVILAADIQEIVVMRASFQQLHTATWEEAGPDNRCDQKLDWNGVPTTGLVNTAPHALWYPGGYSQVFSYKVCRIWVGGNLGQRSVTLCK